MENITLENSNYIELAELLEISRIEHLEFKPIEAKTLFDLKDPVSKLSDFDWNISAEIIEGRIDGKMHYYPMAKYSQEFLKGITWHPKSVTAASIGYIASKLTEKGFLEKLQQRLYEDFDYLSLGQAKTVIKRYIGATLTSSERNDISKINQKIDACRQMIETFEGMLSKRDLDMAIRAWKSYQQEEPLDPSEIVSKSTSTLRFLCFECKTYVDFPVSEKSEPIQPPIHHDRPMSLAWKARLSSEETMQAHRELEEKLQNPQLRKVEDEREKNITKIDHDINLYCTKCHGFFDIDENLSQELLQSDRRVELPQHHGKEMQIRIGKRLTDKEKIKQLQSLQAAIASTTATALYKCVTCDLIIEFDESDDYSPEHHGQEMIRVKVHQKSD